VAEHDCNAAHLRMRDARTDFYDLVDGENFIDSEFPVNDAIYWQDDGGYALDSSPVDHADFNLINWMRPNDSRFLGDDFTLFGTDGVTTRDIFQG